MISSVANWITRRLEQRREANAVEALVDGKWVAVGEPSKQRSEALPSDMSTTSLLGGGLIAGDALAALGLGVVGLLATVIA